MTWKKKTVLGFLALFALIFIFLVEEHFRGAWALSRWKARMAAKGEPTTIGQAIPVPSGKENAMPKLSAAALGLSSLPWKTHIPPPMMYASSGKVVVITRVAEWPV